MTFEKATIAHMKAYIRLEKAQEDEKRAYETLRATIKWDANVLLDNIFRPGCWANS